jgi:hypothetical protein
MRTSLLTGLLASLHLVAVVSAADDPKEVLEDLTSRFRKGALSLDALLLQYNRIESQKHIDIFGRRRIHEGLVRELRGATDPKLLGEAEARLRRASKAELPGQVLLLKAALGEAFPGSRQEKVALYIGALKAKDERLNVWGARLLGDSKWPEAVEALIQAMAEAEATTAPDSFLISLLGQELYRVLGAKATGGSGRIRAGWEQLGRKVPAQPDHSLTGDSAVTGIFFGDRLSPRAVLCIDTSSSMEQRTTLKEARGATAVRGRERRPTGTEPKITIVKRELERAVGSLGRSSQFNIVTYSAAASPWRGKAPLKLVPAREDEVSAARDFARGLRTASGTNIHDAMVLGLETAGVETIYLLSDGVPSRGGSPEEILERVAAMNYLLGARVITYGFAAEEQGAYDEAFMQKLAAAHRGWYRRLN